MKSTYAKRPKFLTEDNVKTLKSAKRIFDKIHRNMLKLEEERKWLEENKDKDCGGERWVNNRQKCYDALDYLFNALLIDAYGYPFFAESREKWMSDWSKKGEVK